MKQNQFNYTDYIIKYTTLVHFSYHFHYLFKYLEIQRMLNVLCFTDIIYYDTDTKSRTTSLLSSM